MDFRISPRAARLALSLILAVGASACGNSARNHARARAVLERAGAGFVDTSTAEYAAVRHGVSGLECLAPRDGEFSLEVSPPSAANPGVYCSNAVGGVATMFVAVFFGPDVTIDTAFSQAVAASAGQTAAQPWPGEPSAADKSSPDGLPHFRIARYEAAINGEESYLRIAVSEARGWFLQQIVSGPIADAEAIEAAAGTDWRRALAAFAIAPPQ